jgi:hypothetical protein
MKYFICNQSMNNSYIVMQLNGVTSAVPMDEANTDYQAYLAWVAEGNTATEWLPEA